VLTGDLDGVGFVVGGGTGRVVVGNWIVGHVVGVAFAVAVGGLRSPHTLRHTRPLGHGKEEEEEDEEDEEYVVVGPEEVASISVAGGVADGLLLLL
jgi:hypothetical protein